MLEFGASLDVGAWNLELFFRPFVNAKRLAQPALQAGPSRCESGHGCQPSPAGFGSASHFALKV